MRHFFTALLLCIVQLQISAHAQTPNWLVGCWEAPDGSAREVWVRESDNALMGFGVVVQNNEVVFYELLKVETKDGGEVQYTAYPADQSPTTFTAKDQGGLSIVFENPQHDYPQKITYRREGDQLLASTSAMDGGSQQSFDKQACK